MRLCDDGVSDDSAQLIGYLAGRGAFRPHRLQPLDPFFRPGHQSRNSKSCCRAPPQPIGDLPVISQPPNSPNHAWVRTKPGEASLQGVNWAGLKTLYIKEVRRFFKVQLQTVWAPAVTTMLYLVIFTVAMGRSGRMVMGFH